MGEGNELWDDSALTNAFNHAMASFKDAHSSKNLGDELQEGMYPSVSNEKDVAFTESTMGHAESENEIKCIFSNTTETCMPNDCNKVPLEGQSTQENDITGGNSYFFSDQQNTDYNQLLNQYYELENQKLKIVEQLNQANYWNYQTPMQNSANQPPQVSECATSGHGVQASFQSCLCHCVAVPLVPAACSLCCPSLQPLCSHISCSGIANANAATDLACSTNCMTENNGTTKVGIQAAESTKNQMGVASSSKDNEEKGENDMSSKESDQTDLMTVLNAWYTAGFYTGRYLEQSKKNARRGS